MEDTHQTNSAINEQDEEISLLDLALILAENWKALLIGPLSCGLIALGISFLAPPTYTAKTVILPPQQQQSAAAAALQSLGALAGMAASAAGLKNPADQYVALLQSDTIADRIIDSFDLRQVYKAKYREDAHKELRNKCAIRAGIKDGLITIQVDDHDPKRAAAIANRYVDELRKLMSELAVTEAQQRRRFFEEKMIETKNRLIAAEKALQSSGLNEGAVRAEPKAAADSYAALRAQVTAAEVRMQSMRTYLTEEAPAFQQALAQLNALRQQLARIESANSGAAKGDYISRYREFKYQETLFELLARQYELARVDESREGMLVQVVDVAIPPERKSKPRRALIGIITTISSALIIGVILLLREGWRNAAKRPESAEKVAQLRRLLSLRRA